jgi:hypothetical protein
MKPEIFTYNHPEMNAPLEATIAFDYAWRHAQGRDYEEIYPYIEAVYIGNVDVMPLLSNYLLNTILNEYKGSRNEDV